MNLDTYAFPMDAQHVPLQKGVTKLEYVAAICAQGLLAHDADWSAEFLAQQASKYASAIITECKRLQDENKNKPGGGSSTVDSIT